MKFYGRQNELSLLEELWSQSSQAGKMLVLTGKRQIGKTALAIQFAKDKPNLYLFVARKSENLLCQHFVEQIREHLNIKIHGKIETFREVFSLLLEHARTQQFTLIIDEFQEFYRINPSVYSEIQHLWDLNKHYSHLTLIFIGSVYSLMHKIFENEKEPLFGRADRIVKLHAFTISELKMICADYHIRNIESLFEIYVLTGGVPKYVNYLLTNGGHTLSTALDVMLEENSPFINEGKNQLIEEFGKEYSIYFSLLELISLGKTGSGELASIIQKNASAYLENLDKTYDIIKAVRPINAKPAGKLQKYYIIDNFLHFWFRFIYRYREAIEIKNYDYIKALVLEEFSTYSGKFLEKFLLELIATTGNFNRLGAYWERDGKNEIDIVAMNDRKKNLFLAEVKLNKKKASLSELQKQAAKLISLYPGYAVTFSLLDLDDAAQYLSQLEK